MSEPAWDRELVLSELGLVADILANTERIIELRRRKTMAEKRKEIDFTEQRARIKEVRDLIERERARLREQREAEERRKTG